MIDWSKYPNFQPAEFRCKHTGKDGIREEFLNVLQAIRTEYGKPMSIASGYRHPTHPVEAAKKSKTAGEHTLGMCADIACTTSGDRYQLVRLAMKHGINRIGIAKNFLHLGLGGPGLPPNVIWDY